MKTIELLNLDTWTSDKYQTYLSEKYKISIIHHTIDKIPIHWHDFYEIDLCLDGYGTTLINGREYPVSAGYLSFMTPIDIHTFNIEKPLTILNIKFDPSWIEYSNFSESFLITHFVHRKISPEQIELFKLYINAIKSEITTDKFMTRSYILHLLSCLLIEILRISRDNKENHEDGKNELSNVVQKMVYYVHMHFKEDITLESVANYVELSPTYVSNLFKTHLGYGFKSLLNNLRLKHAENLLIHSNESVTNISYFCGFQSFSHFLKAFKRKNNISPREFRKNRRITEKNYSDNQDN